MTMMKNTLFLKRSNHAEGPSSIEVLRFRELSHEEYQCRDYLASAAEAATVAAAATTTAGSSNIVAVVTAATRVEMLKWVQKVMAYMKFSDNVSILTATLLDRFLQTEAGQKVLTSLPDFRLATMGCLYLTAKIHDPCVVISSEVMSAFSQGMFSAEQVEATELVILKAMNWHIYPPTALEFVREFLLLLPCSVSHSMKEQAYNHCQGQIERCILHYEAFALTEASTIAFFAVQNALRSLGMDSIILGHVAAIFSYATHTDYYSQPDKELIVQTCLLGRLRQAAEASSKSSCSGKRRKNNSSVKQQQHQRHNKKGRRSSHRGSNSSSTSTSATASTSTSCSRQSWTRRPVSFNESPCGVVH